MCHENLEHNWFGALLLLSPLTTKVLAITDILQNICTLNTKDSSYLIVSRGFSVDKVLPI